MKVQFKTKSESSTVHKCSSRKSGNIITFSCTEDCNYVRKFNIKTNETSATGDTTHGHEGIYLAPIAVYSEN